MRRGLLVACLAIVGGVAGFVLAHRGALSGSDVEAAARSIRPPTFHEVRVTAGQQGTFPPPGGPYVVVLTLGGGGSVDDRMNAIRSQTAQWSTRISAVAAGPQLQLKRGELSGEATIRKTGDTVVVIRYPNQTGHRAAFTGVGALLGAIAGLASLAVTSARRNRAGVSTGAKA
jgi:hypothetical protein